MNLRRKERGRRNRERRKREERRRREDSEWVTTFVEKLPCKCLFTAFVCMHYDNECHIYGLVTSHASLHLRKLLHFFRRI